MDNRTSQLIRFFVEKFPGCGRAQIVKSLYLADLEARRCLGRAITSLNYIVYDGGPFDSDILAELDRMESGGLLKVDRRAENGMVLLRYLPTEGKCPNTFSEEEDYILTHVAEVIRSAVASSSLDDLIAQSKPMTDARQRDGFGCRLRMELVDNEAIIPGLELTKILQSMRDLAAGKGRPLKEIMAAIRDKVPSA